MRKGELYRKHKYLKKRYEKSLSFYLRLIIFFLVLFFTFSYFTNSIQVGAFHMSEDESKQIVSYIVYDTINEYLIENKIKEEEIFTFHENIYNEIEAVQLETVKLKNMSYDLADKITNRLISINNKKVYLPLSAFLNNSSNTSFTGVYLTYRLVPNKKTEVDIYTDSIKIDDNFTKYSIKMKAVNYIDIVFPLGKSTFRSIDTLTLAEIILNNRTVYKK